MRFYLHSFGCRVNQADGDGLADALAAVGHVAVADPAAADLIILNSCTVTHRGDADLRQTVRRLHRAHPSARLAVIGCYAERAPQDAAALPGVSVVAGTGDPDRLVAALAEGHAVPGAVGMVSTAAMDVPVAWRGHTRPMVKVQDGCNAACAYCIVPAVRGAERSAPPDAVTARIAALAADGAREIILTGIHLGRYGHTLAPPLSLAGLLERLLRETPVGRVRLSSVEPLEFDAALLALIGREPRLAPHFHVPLQSGSAAVLARMGRPYAPDQYLAVVRRLAALRPQAALGADVIAGFPGETEAEFQDTAALVAASPLTYLHVFPFSPRHGTRAAAMRGRLPEREVARRTRILRDIGQASRRRHLEACLGRTLPALVLRSGGRFAGSQALTENYINLALAEALPPNTAVDVRIHAIDSRGQASGTLA